jgi:hypothetical protein
MLFSRQHNKENQMKLLVLFAVLLSFTAYSNETNSSLLGGRSILISYAVQPTDDELDQFQFWSISHPEVDKDIEISLQTLCEIPGYSNDEKETLGQEIIPRVPEGTAYRSNVDFEILNADIERCEAKGGKLYVYATIGLHKTKMVHISKQVVRDLVTKGNSERMVKGKNLDRSYLFITTHTNYEFKFYFKLNGY